MSTMAPHADSLTQARQRPLATPIRNPVSRALLWASKTDPRVVAMCSRWAIATQTALGVFVAFTGVMAFGSAFVMANAHCISPSNPGGPCTIEFNQSYIRSASEEAVKNTMKHELIHAWMHSKGISDSNMHGHVFVMKGKEVGCDVTRYERELAEKRKKVIAVSENSNSLESTARPS